MKIFNVEIFGSDADWFCELSKEEKKEWILNNTNQKSEEKIEEYLNSKIVNDNKLCLSCGQLDNKIHNPNANITSGIPTTIANSTETTKVTGDSSGTNTKRRTSGKTTKGK